MIQIRREYALYPYALKKHVCEQDFIMIQGISDMTYKYLSTSVSLSTWKKASADAAIYFRRDQLNPFSD